MRTGEYGQQPHQRPPAAMSVDSFEFTSSPDFGILSKPFFERFDIETDGASKAEVWDLLGFNELV